MIVSYKGLELYATKGDRSKLQQQHIDKVKAILSRLDAAKDVQIMILPGYNLHKLSGRCEGFYLVKVNGNWRIIFLFRK